MGETNLPCSSYLNTLIRDLSLTEGEHNPHSLIRGYALQLPFKPYSMGRCFPWKNLKTTTAARWSRPTTVVYRIASVYP